MKKFFTMLFCLDAVISVQADTHRPDTRISLQCDNLSVSNMQTSLIFYRDYLGFSVRSITPYSAPNLRKMFHVPEGVIAELAILDASELQPRTLALVYVKGQKVDRLSNKKSTPALVFNTTKMDIIHNRMLKANVEILQSPASLIRFSGKAIAREAA